MKPIYRPDIDGLRAIAVLAVVFGHANFSIAGMHPFQGGFLGVDVFFVISGYLITKILIIDANDGRFDLARFYERRARRILPALFVVLASTVPFAWLWMMPDQLQNFAQSLGASLLFSANFFFWRDSGYFSETIELKPLFHLWSLSVEEQFYLFYPLALLALHRLRLPRQAFLLAAFLFSLGLSTWATMWAPSASFYLLPTRAWELLAGAIVAHMEVQRGGRPFGRGAALGQTASFALLLFSIVLFSPATPHPGVLTLAPVAASAGLIWFSSDRSWVYRLLSFRPIVGVGLISYSLYLWHQPLFAFARLYSIDEVPEGVFLALILAAITLAALTWRFIEQPFRQPAQVSSRRLWIASAGAACVFGALSLATVGSGGFPQRLPAVAQAAADVAVGYGNLAGEDCFREPCTIGTEANPSIAVIGDSHAGTLAQSLDFALRGAGLSGRMLAFGDVWLTEFPAWYDDAHVWNSALDQQRVEIAEIDTVVLVGRYTLRLLNTPFDNGEGGVESLDASYTGRDREQTGELLRHTEEGIMSLVSAGKRVVLVHPIPEVGWDVPSTLVKLSMRELERGLTTSYEAYLDRNRLVRELFDRLALMDGVSTVDPAAIFCKAGRCATHDGTSIYYHDDDHLSVAGADLLASAILEKLLTR